ncbi:hypothetical protein FIBSPDRAFT_862227 [Athelia psychrophila]|uniref:Uncharacterized protein n=1 Tax=Athelia psychrophila TaxID=1759441 RepID=A0A166IMI2_9AGAM|nr:hypothetical protein FIBSPDRAFT_862227 [Fibularhizoctonia sp. CBS 109695]
MVSSLTEDFEDELHLAPNLRSLTMRWPGPFPTKKGFSLHHFVNMVESRWTHRGAALDAALMRSPLSHVKVNDCISTEIYVSNSPIARLRRILEEGLDVKFLTAETNDITICKRNLLSSPPYTIQYAH